MIHACIIDSTLIIRQVANLRSIAWVPVCSFLLLFYFSISRSKIFDFIRQRHLVYPSHFEGLVKNNNAINGLKPSKQIPSLFMFS